MRWPNWKSATRTPGRFRSSPAAARNPSFIAEPLEQRCLLSAITWSNRGVTSGPDDDRFNSVFGAGAAAARGVVDAALTSWARLITNFNFPGGSNTYTIKIQMDATGTATGASASPSHWTTDGKPDQGSMRVGRGSDTNGDTLGDGGGYFIDPTPYDYSEFQDHSNNAFAVYADNTSPAFNKGDLYELVLHEIGHAVGFISRPPTNPGLSSHSTNTAVGDSIDPPFDATPTTSPTGFYYRFDGAHVRGLLTSYDSNGDAAGTDSGSPSHYAPPGASFPLNGYTYLGVDDLMTPYYDKSQRRLVSENDILMLEDTYGYTVQDAGYYGSAYDTLDATGKLRIRTPGNGVDSVSLSVGVGNTLVVQMGLGSPVAGADPTIISSVFDINAVTSIEINTGDGNDNVTIVPYGNIPTTIVGGQGTDTLFYNGVTGTTTIDRFTISGPFLQAYLDIENLIINGTNAAESFVANLVDLYQHITIHALGGNDSMTFGNGNLIGLAVLSFDGGAGSDSIYFDNSSSAHAWGYGSTSSSLFSNNLGVSYNRTDSFPNTETLSIAAGSHDDIFSVATTDVGSFTFLSGGAGNDSLQVGDPQSGISLSDIKGSLYFSGGDNTDTMVLDDRGATGARTYSIDGFIAKNQLSGNVGIDSNTETLSIYGPTAFSSTFNLTGGTASTALSLVGGNAYDTFHLTGGAYFNGALYGGTGSDSLIADDSAAPSNLFRAELTSTSLSRDFGNLASYTRYTLSLANIDLPSYYAGPFTNTINIRGTPASAYDYATVIYGSANADTFTLFPHDALGANTLLAKLDLVGNNGVDSFVLDDTANPAPVTYDLNDPGVPNFAELLTGPDFPGFVYIERTIEALALSTSAFDDTINLSGINTGQALTILGNDGSDTVNFTPVSMDVAAHITSISYFNFDGGPGTDSFNVHNESNNNAWSYSRGLSTVSASKPGYGLTLNDPNTEYVYLYAGPQADTFSVSTLPAYSYTAFYGGAGADASTIGTGLTDAISGVVALYGDAADTAIINDTADATGRTLHIKGHTVGAIPGDDLFNAAGGYLVFYDLAGLTVNLGSGADVVYAAPDPTSPITVNANAPAAAPGDALTLALADAVNPHIIPGAPGAGTATSDNLMTLAWTGFETGPTTDDVAPYVVSIAFNNSAAPQSLVFTLSEPLAYDPGVYSLALTKTSTGAPVPVPYADIAETYDANALTLTFTFPNFPGAVLPAGVYQATLTGSYLSDLAGNMMPGTATYTFLWVPTAATLVTGDTATTVVQAVAIAPGGVLDLRHGALVLDYEGNGAAALAQLAALIRSGRNGYDANIITNWNGSGIVSSAARTQSVSAGFDLYTLGVIDNASLADPQLGRDAYSVFRGQSVDASSIFIRFTYSGDADLNGFVDGDDYALIDNAFNSLIPNFGWLAGDFNYDGLIDGDDYALIDSGFLFQQAPIL